jgi:type II secretory pathway pseudopilin PulG
MRLDAHPAGYSLTELVLVVAIVGLTCAASVPTWAATVDAGRARHAAQFVASACRDARTQAIARNATEALVFDQSGARWTYRRCHDGNGNGLRRADITRGTDTCDAVVDLGTLFGGVRIATDASVPDPDGGAGSIDPVKFGASNVASFTPAGTATAGTVYLQSPAGALFAVRVAGATGRTRVLRFNQSQSNWQEE